MTGQHAPAQPSSGAAVTAAVLACSVLALGGLIAVRADPQARPGPAAGPNIAASQLGGEIESVTGAYGGPGLQGEALIDEAIQSTWQPDLLVHPPEGVDSADVRILYPQDIVISFYKRDVASVSAVVLETDPDTPGPAAADILVSTDASPTTFKKVAAAHFAKGGTNAQTISFTPVDARFVKVSLTAGPADNVGLRRIRIIEGARAGYTSLAARHPELAQWRGSVRHAAQRGIDWLEPYAMDWQLHQKCFGCHVQAQTMMGLAIARTNNYVVSDDTLKKLAAETAAFQVADGHEKYEGYDTVTTPTQFAAMGVATYDEAAGIKTDPVLRRYADWMIGHMSARGELAQDLNYAPVSQGSINSTSNAVAGLMEVYAQTGDERYRTQAERGVAFVATAKPETMQDRVFRALTLAQYGTPAQRALVTRDVQEIEKAQNPDGGWSPTPEANGSDAFATGQVLYAFKEAGVNIESPSFNRGVRYLIDTQKPIGAWGGDGDQASLFAPTMWAVIGLAGTLEVPPEEALRDELKRTGKIVLYVNFDFNKSTIRPDATPVLAQVVKLLADTPDLKLAVNGYTDNVGTAEYNKKLSDQRAAAVMAALVAKGIAASRLSSAGMGQDSPIADNNTDRGRAKNRRVELVRQ